MANWTPGGAVGRFFALLARYGLPDGGPSPTAWGDAEHVGALLGGTELRTERRHIRLRFPGPADELCAY